MRRIGNSDAAVFVMVSFGGRQVIEAEVVVVRVAAGQHHGCIGEQQRARVVEPRIDVLPGGTERVRRGVVEVGTLSTHNQHLAIRK